MIWATAVSVGEANGQAAPAVANLLDAPRAGERIEVADGSAPLLAGFAAGGPIGEPVAVASFREFADCFGAGAHGPFMPSAALAHAVRGFFHNGGAGCWVLRLSGIPGEGRAGEQELAALMAVESSVVAVPDAYRLAGGLTAAVELQRRLVALAEATGTRFVVLDPPPALTPGEVVLWRRRLEIDAACAVVYYPWVAVPALPAGSSLAVPPSGHAIGSWARSTATAGIHHAPTGQPLLGIDAPAASVTAGEQRSLNREGVNCLRAFPGPEPRVWGARTLSSDSDWRYLHRRRTYVQLISSIALGTGWVGEALLDEDTIDRLEASVSAFLQAAWRRGALCGAATGQAFSISCERSDEHSGHIALELGLALRQPAEFRVARLILRTASASERLE